MAGTTVASTATDDVSVNEPKKTHKRDALRAIEKEKQVQWAEQRVFEVDAPEYEGSDLHEKHPKYFITFPYPYMNGRLHLGHVFSFSKNEFAAGYERLKGKRVLWPFGFHCTGMPIKACADKLKREIEMFGVNFDQTVNSLAQDVSGMNIANGSAPPKHSKAAAKSGGATYQYQIMQSLGIPTAEIHKFADTDQWLSYFPPRAMSDMQSFGCRIDWRRSFITTDANPFYDSFVRWQMRKLRALDKIKFGERYTIYSAVDGQPCMDHDRASGEGIGPQEYTGIKLQVVEFPEDAVKQLSAQCPDIANRTVFFVAATLRPETMYGQTNCFVGTAIEYGFFENNSGGLYVCTERAARNMAFQGLLKERGQVSRVATLAGASLIGTRVKAPLSTYEAVYVLPMENVLPTKGTGIVTSVPSDSPDDYITTQDLIKKATYYKIDASWIAPYAPVPIIQTSFGNMCAVSVCQSKKIASQKDKAMLAEAKEICYKEGFYNGTMLVGPFAGQPVQDAKPRVRQQLIEAGLAFAYNEPEGLVMSRSGDECVVALCDQWYLDYGEPAWRATTAECLRQLNTYADETRHQFERTLDWFTQWACSRSYGLGTRMPWDEQFLVESLSDSTIYMAYYTVCHLLHGGTLNGSEPGPLGIVPADMTDAVWDYVLTGGPMPTDGRISQDKLKLMRREFNYFYPIDIRTSGKDLVPNHLTMSLYNHTAIFPPEKWPRAFRANGHLLLNREKMSKSTGNFMTLYDAVEKFGADATRIALADAGDSIEDANFEEATANAAVLRLYTLMEWMEETYKARDTLRTGPTNFHDRAFEQEVSRFTALADASYADMRYRDVLKDGFYELQTALSWYKEAVQTSGGIHRDMALLFIEIEALILCPIVPHWSEHVWMDILGKKTSIMSARWPSLAAADEAVLDGVQYARKVVRQVRELELTTQRKKTKKGTAAVFNASQPKAINIYIASKFPDWQEDCIGHLKQHYSAATKSFDDAKIIEALQRAGMIKDKKVMPFLNETKKNVLQFGPSRFNRALQFREADVLAQYRDYIHKNLGFSTVNIISTDEVPADDEFVRVAETAIPGDPSYRFWNC